MAISITAQSGTFTITDAPTVTITSPNSGSYAYTSSIVVQFTKTNFTSGVNLYYTSGTTFSTSNLITTNFTGTQYTWDIPDTLSGTNKYIWVAKTDDTSIRDRTNNAISITSITITKSPSEVSDFSETVTDSKSPYKTVFSTDDDTGFTESITDSKITWKHIKAASEVSDFTESVTDSKRTWKHIKLASEVSDFTETVTDSKRTWKHIITQSEVSDFTESITDNKRTWKHIKPATDSTQFSGDTVTHEIVKWKQIISDISDFIESVSYYKTIGVPSANDSSQFIEDINAVVHKRCKVRLFQDSGTENYATSHKTGWLPASNKLDKNSLIRRLNLEYHSADPINVKIYADGDTINPVFTSTLAAATNKETTNKRLRVGKRAKYFMLEMSTAASTNDNVKIEDVEIEVNG